MATTPYLTVDEWKVGTNMPGELVAALELTAPGHLAKQLVFWSAWINSKLAKRYDVPFSAPYPEVVQYWLTAIVTVRAFLRQGVRPTDEQYTTIKQDCDDAIAQITEAANSDTGLFELPLRADTSASGVTRGGPFSYTEASPYVWTDDQVDRARDEDRGRSGSTGG